MCFVFIAAADVIADVVVVVDSDCIVIAAVVVDIFAAAGVVVEIGESSLHLEM